jgi:hypothetical protein
MLVNRFDAESRKIKDQYYNNYLKSLNRLACPKFCGDNFEFYNCEQDYLNVDIPIYMVRDMYRMSHKPDMDCYAPEFLHRCLGHKVNESKILKFPRLCVVYASRVLRDRFRLAEDLIAGDLISAYFYSKLVIGGRLPDVMHNRLILGSFGNCDNILKKYLVEFA